ncbi:MAG: transposase family protein [Bacteroidota bacterium]|nr:transposase family protein [Bacteroidota bacterium]
MASSIYQNAAKERQYKAANGLSLAEFDAFYILFAPFYAPKQALPYSPTIPVLLVDKREALLFILHYFKAYPTLQNRGLYFGMSDASVSNCLTRLKPCLKAALVQQNVLAHRLFANQQAFEAAFAGEADLFIDVTEFPIERAVNQEAKKGHYSEKKFTA